MTEKFLSPATKRTRLTITEKSETSAGARVGGADGDFICGYIGIQMQMRCLSRSRIISEMLGVSA